MRKDLLFGHSDEVQNDTFLRHSVDNTRSTFILVELLIIARLIFNLDATVILEATIERYINDFSVLGSANAVDPTKDALRSTRARARGT